MTGAGFADPELERLEFRFEYADEDDAWGALIELAGPLARVVKALPDAEREATRRAIIENLAPYRQEDGSYSAPAAAWAVLAR